MKLFKVTSHSSLIISPSFLFLFSYTPRATTRRITSAGAMRIIRRHLMRHIVAYMPHCQHIGLVVAAAVLAAATAEAIIPSCTWWAVRRVRKTMIHRTMRAVPQDRQAAGKRRCISIRTIRWRRTRISPATIWNIWIICMCLHRLYIRPCGRRRLRWGRAHHIHRSLGVCVMRSWMVMVALEAVAAVVEAIIGTFIRPMMIPVHRMRMLATHSIQYAMLTLMIQINRPVAAGVMFMPLIVARAHHRRRLIITMMSRLWWTMIRSRWRWAEPLTVICRMETKCVKQETNKINT